MTFDVRLTERGPAALIQLTVEFLRDRTLSLVSALPFWIIRGENPVGIDIDNASAKVDLQRLVVNKLPGRVETIAG